MLHPIDDDGGGGGSNDSNDAHYETDRIYRLAGEDEGLELARGGSEGTCSSIPRLKKTPSTTNHRHATLGLEQDPALHQLPTMSPFVPSPPPSAQPPRSESTKPAAPRKRLAPTSTRVLAAAAPQRKIFDPWNSSSKGHQHAENRLSSSTSWRASRTAKLASQFTAGASGGERLYDAVGAGSRGFGRDGRTANGGWDASVRGARGRSGMLGAEAARTGDLGSWVAGEGLQGGVVQDLRAEAQAADESEEAVIRASREQREQRARSWQQEEAERQREQACHAEGTAPPAAEGPPPKRAAALFDGCVVYINGSTMPHVSDHRLKTLLAEHGARVSLALGRRSVTHVVLGEPNARGGVGGGLAGGKIQREISRVRGEGVRFVGVQWYVSVAGPCSWLGGWLGLLRACWLSARVLECIRAGKRLPEARFANTSTGPCGVKSIYDIFKPVERKVADVKLGQSKSVGW